MEKKTKTSNSKPVTTEKTYKEPANLSKAGQWMRDNPGGIFEVRDWRAVNK